MAILEGKGVVTTSTVLTVGFSKYSNLCWSTTKYLFWNLYRNTVNDDNTKLKRYVHDVCVIDRGNVWYAVDKHYW